MSNINFTCPHCSHSVQLPADTLGKQGNCPGCKTMVQIVATPQQPLQQPLQQQPLQQQPIQQQPLQQQPLQQQPLQQQPLQQPLQQQPIGWSTPPLPKEPRQKSQTSDRSGNNKKFVIVGSAVGIFILLITVSLFFLLGGDESASTSDSPSERQVATDPNDDGGSGMDGGGETGVRGGMSGDTNPTGGSAGNTFRGGKDQLAALNGHWKRTHFYQHDDHGDMKDGIAGSIVKDLSSDTIQTGHKYYDSRSKIWIQVFRDGTSRSGTFDVLADPIHSGKFAMKLVYADGSGDWDTHKHYLSNNNTTWDQQWVTAMYLRTGETKPSQHNAERWIYVDGKTSP